MDLITFPYAMSRGRVVHIDTFPKGDSCKCLLCEQEMIPKQGSKNRWHFSHKTRCDCRGEGALHRAAKNLIQQGFESAKQSGRKYVLRWECPKCKTSRSSDCCGYVDNVEQEVAVMDNVRADLVFEGRMRFAVEVVVSHEIEEPTEERYRRAGMRVFTYEPDWDSLSSLVHGFTTTRALHLDSTKCERCRINAKKTIRRQQERELAAKKLQQELDFVRNTPSRVRSYLDSIRRPSNEKITWIACPELDEQRGTVEVLCQAGFKQQSQKPWVFYIELAEWDVIFLADLDGRGRANRMASTIKFDRRPLLRWEFGSRAKVQDAVRKQCELFCRRLKLDTRLSWRLG